MEEDDVSQEEMIGDELHVIDEVEEDDVSQEEVIDEKGLVGDERQSFLSVSTWMSTVNFAAVHKEPMADRPVPKEILTSAQILKYAFFRDIFGTPWEPPPPPVGLVAAVFFGNIE